MTRFFRKHWEKIVLSLCAIFWSGCGDDSSSSKDEPTACTLMRMCPEYGVFYTCENEEDYNSPDMYEKCTKSYPSCSNDYHCEDGISCWENTKDNTTIYNCHDQLENEFTYTESEFNSKYYVKEKY